MSSKFKPVNTTHILKTALLLLLILAGCRGAWSATLEAPDGTPNTIGPATLRDLAAFAAEDGSVPLERILYANGYRVLEDLRVTTPDDALRTFAWADVAKTAQWHADGTVTLGEETLQPLRIAGTSPASLSADILSIMDIAPTAAAILGIPAPEQATGQVIVAAPASHVLLLFLDGFGYARYVEARDAGLAPTLTALGDPFVALTVYPPATAVASAALLTGAPPDVNGVTGRGLRTTDVETLFDVVAQAGRRGVAVEGDALAFNLRNADVTLSGDRDGNGSTDDNVRANALDVLRAGMPDLLWVHFHGIDDAGHTYGPGAPEERAAVATVDAAVGDILAALPPDTFVLIFADHGMHAVQEGERLGNHGHLIARDMLVPVWIWATD